MIFILFICLLSVCSGKKVSYAGDEIWQIFSDSEHEMRSIQEILINYNFDIWGGRIGTIDFRVPHNLVCEMKTLWDKNNMSYDVIIPNLGKLIEEEIKVRNMKSKQKEDIFSFDQYHTLDEIFIFLDDLSATSHLVRQQEIGRTNEGREIRLMIVSSPNGPTYKPAIWIDCGIHAREWISIATCLWGLNYFTSQYNVDADVTNFLDGHDLYILPVLNPDGYSYTWTDDRLWRKNRMQYKPDCVGTDLNRNYNSGHWGGVGSSNDPCNEVYRGPAPFSELETLTVRAKVVSIQETQILKAFFSLQSYGQLFLFAFGWTGDLPTESEELYRVSQVGVDAISSFSGMVYVNGPHYPTIYPATGNVVDWGYSIGIATTFIVELRDSGQYGFLLPEDHILPTATEAWAGVTAAVFAI